MIAERLDSMHAAGCDMVRHGDFDPTDPFPGVSLSFYHHQALSSEPGQTFGRIRAEVELAYIT